MAKPLSSTLRPKTPAQPANRKSSVPILPRKTQHGVDWSVGQRETFRRLHVHLRDNGQRGASFHSHSPTRGRLSRSQLDHNPLGPAVRGHLAPMMSRFAHRESIQAPVLVSIGAVAPTPSNHSLTHVKKVMNVEPACRQIWLDASLHLAALADTLSEADYCSPRYWPVTSNVCFSREGQSIPSWIHGF
jgi:hypothetical protein